ncbi:MAG: YgjV family protein [Clostridia bacterium]|nr:YgjV family protein [Clostridia bacterium]
MYITSQVFFIIGAVIILATYYLKNRRLILSLSIAACVAYFTAYIFLKAYTGAALNIVSLIATIWFFIDLKKRGKRSWVSLGIIFALAIAMTTTMIALRLENMISVLATVALMAFIYSIWQDNLFVHKWLGIVTAICWILYNCYYSSIIPIISNTIFIIIDLISIIRCYRLNKKEGNK